MGTLPKMRGLKLFAAVYEEIAGMVPDGAMSITEILGATQALIECTREDYVDVYHHDAIQKAGYFSYDVCVAMEKFQGRVLINELFMDDDEPHTLRKLNYRKSWALLGCIRKFIMAQYRSAVALREHVLDGHPAFIRSYITIWCIT